MDTLFNIFNTNDKTHHSLNDGDKFNQKKKYIKNKSCNSYSNSLNTSNSLNNYNKKWFDNRNKKEFGFKEGFDSRKSYNELREEYSNVLSEYRRISADIVAAETDYINRTTTNTGNKFLNKNIKFNNTDNPIYAYVTNKGIVKKFGTQVMFNKTAGLNGCPDRNYIDVNIPWISAYDVAGATIQMPQISGSVAGPKLIVGAPMTQGESCGYEGSNVFVDKMMDTVRSQFMGCFDNSINTGYPMGNNYVGGSEPYVNYIQNGNFALSTYSGIGDVNVTANTITNWTTTNTGDLVVLINKSQGTLKYPIPYSNGDRAVSLKNTGDLSQTFTGLVAGNYTLTFDACGLSVANPTNIFLNDTLTPVGTITPSLTWTSHSVQLSNATPTKITFKGTGTAGQMSAIQNIRLTNGTASAYTNAVSFAECETAAKTGSYTYFGLQNVDQLSTSSTFRKGFCALSNDANLIPSLTVASDLSPENLLQAGSTDAANKGISATLTVTGVLLVNTLRTNGNPGTPIPMSTNTSSSNNTPCYLILGDDGTMKIYRFPKNLYGTYMTTPPDITDPTKSPSSNDLIWSSVNPTKQLISNPNYTAAKGKGYTLFTSGTNWVAAALAGGITLNPGEFIGSPSGNIYLIMGADGTLSLNTSKYASTCKANSVTGVMEGGINSASVYKVNTVSDNLFTFLGKLFFINDDASLKEYPDTNKKLSNDYIQVSSYDTPVDTDALKYNIGTPTTGKTLADCKIACNGNTNCYGYSYTTTSSSSNNICNLKGSNIKQDKGDGPATLGTDLYVRKETYKSNIPGVANTFSSIFSNQKQNYSVDASNKNVPPNYGINTLVPDKRIQLADLQTQLDDLQSQMDVYTGTSSSGTSGGSSSSNYGSSSSNYGTGTSGSSSSSSSGNNPLNSIIKEIESTEKKISNIQSVKNTNLDNMLGDTDLIVLQENYKYLCWSILASASVLIYVNVSN